VDITWHKIKKAVSLYIRNLEGTRGGSDCGHSIAEVQYYQINCFPLFPLLVFPFTITPLNLSCINYFQSVHEALKEFWVKLVIMVPNPPILVTHHTYTISPMHTLMKYVDMEGIWARGCIEVLNFLSSL